MEIKLAFTDEELAELVSSIQNAPVGGFGKIDKNREVYALPTKRLANKVAEKINAVLAHVATLDEDGIVPSDQLPEMNYVAKSGDRMTGELTVGQPIVHSKVNYDGLSVVIANDTTKYGNTGVKLKNVNFLFPTTKKEDDTFAMMSDVDAQTTQALHAARMYTDEKLATFNFIEIVSALPETGSPNKIYLVAKTDGEEQDLFNAWIWVNKATEDSPAWGWEFEGTKKAVIDLSVLSEYVKLANIANGLFVNSAGNIIVKKAEMSQIDAQENAYNPIVPSTVSHAVKVGVTANKETLTDEDQTNACDWLGALRTITTETAYQQAYIKQINGTQLMLNVSDGALGGALVKRLVSGNILLPQNPTDDSFAVPKKYVDDNFLPIDKSVTTSHQAYVKAASGTTTMWNMDNGPTPSAICVRDGNGRLRIADPLNGGDAVNKTYFEANKGSVWYKHTIEQTVEGIGIFDMLITSTRSTAYTSGQEIIDDWNEGKISSFFNSSLGKADTLVTRLQADGCPWGHATVSNAYGSGYWVTEGTFTDDFEKI